MSLRIDKNKVLTLFALTLLITSLPLVNIIRPVSADQSDIYLHGPSLVPIHMHGPPLDPVHMHSRQGLIDLYFPWETFWHQLYPDFCEEWVFTSWEDNGNDYLDASDQIDMTNTLTAETRWYHVDRVTMTLHLWTDYWGFDEEIYVEYKGPYDPYIQPVCTNWTEVYPVYLGVTGGPYHIYRWDDNGNGYLDYCDYVYFDDWPDVWWHVEEYATDLILNEKIMDPIDIWWHELYPSYCNWHLLTSWEEPLEDPYPGRLSPGDQIDMLNETSGITKWYFVDRVTLTLNVTIIGAPDVFYLFEYKGSFEDMYQVKTDPVCTYWHMVWPDYWWGCFHLEDWIDNCNGVLDYCDEILLEGEWCHVEGLAIDVILNEKIEDPTCTYWHELYPECCVNDYHIEGWEDNGDKLLSPCDNVTMTLIPTGLTDEYHVEEVTLTLNLTILDYTGPPPPGDRIYVEYTGGYEGMYYAKIYPLDTEWHEVCPEFCEIFYLTYWEDNCNSVLSYCDYIELYNPQWDQLLWCHVDEVAIDITVKKITVEPVHDVAVIDVYSIYDWVYQGDIDPINVTIENQGDFTETVDVYAYYNGNQLRKQTVTLNPGETRILWFYWDTTGVLPGFYTISANTVIPIDNDPSDNNMTGNTEEVRERPIEPWYIKSPYPDYAPSGMPDFDQRQGGTYIWQDLWGAWSHCGPVACANSLWWFDSEYEHYYNPGSPPPPMYSDSFPLVQSYGGPPWDDHDTQNVPYLVEHLAWLMDCDALRTGPATGVWWSGTYVNDMEAGLAHYLSWSGVNPLGDVNGDGVVDPADAARVAAAMGSVPGDPGWDLAADVWPASTTYPPSTDHIIDDNDAALVDAHMGETGIFYEHTADAWEDYEFFWFIEEEVERCQDVVLLLGFYMEGTDIREGGHYVTVAGVNSTTMELLISNPIRDEFEAGNTPGRSPVPHVHAPPEPPYVTHNNASLVSQDAYHVSLLPSPSGYHFVLDGYFDPPYEARIEYAVVTSPLEPLIEPDIAVTNLTICYGQTVVPQGVDLTWINVTVTNEGPTDETFTLTAYWNTTNVIDSTSVSLLSGETKDVQFTWDTSALQRYANYILSAHATPVPGETDTTDNTYVNGTVILVVPGDVDGDKDVDLYDAVALLICYGAKLNSPKYDPNMDIDNDGDIDLYDAIRLLLQYGYKEP